MATFRFLHTEIWNDNFFSELTPEDKYFFIYLLTNEKCTQCGIYNFGVKVVAAELGYSIDTVKTLLGRFVDYGKILYDEKNGEIMILNWYKYNININNKNSRVCINTCLKKVKTPEFIRNLYALCSYAFKDEMNLVKELFSDISFSGPKSSAVIIESNTNTIDKSCCDNENTVKNEEDKTLDSENKSENSVDKYRELDELNDKTVNKYEDEVTYCGKLSEVGSEEYKVIEAFQNNFHKIAPIELEKLMGWCKEVSPEVVIKGIEVATLSDRRSMTYLNGILRNWAESGVKNIGDCERVCREHEKSKANGKVRNEIKPPQYRVLPTERYDDEEDF